MVPPAGLSAAGSTMWNSTRRFLSRPSLVALVSMGRDWPNAFGVRRAGSTPSWTRRAITARARASASLLPAEERRLIVVRLVGDVPGALVRRALAHGVRPGPARRRRGAGVLEAGPRPAVAATVDRGGVLHALLTHLGYRVDLVPV